MVLFTDATIRTEAPPLRACWSPVGVQAEVPITGNRAKRVLYAALGVRSGTVCLSRADRWNRASLQLHLREVRALRRGWSVVLFLDRGSPHTAKRSVALAKELGIELRFLPTACPGLNPVEGQRRHVKGRVLADEPTPDLSASLRRARDEILSMSATRRSTLAGVMSDYFWLPTYACPQAVFR